MRIIYKFINKLSRMKSLKKRKLDKKMKNDNQTHYQ
jgi:hypothetical protein